MKKFGLIFVFIFLTGLFSGLFFSTNLSYENNDYLSSLLLSGFSDSSAGAVKTFFAALASNFTLVIIMASAIITKVLSPIPPIILWYKSFAIGFCSGLVYLNAIDKAFIISLLKIFPQNLFLIPGFLIISTTIFYCSYSEMTKKSRPYQEKKGLFQLASIALVLILLGCLTEAICHLIVL